MMSNLVFIAYSHKDESIRDELETHFAMLKRQGLIGVFHDRRIEPGAAWDHEIHTNLYESVVMLPILSPDFLDSDYCVGVELETAFRLHAESRLVIVPVVARPCEWQQEPRLAAIQAVPRDGLPITSWPDRDECMMQIAASLRQVLSRIPKNGADSRTAETVAEDRWGARFLAPVQARVNRAGLVPARAYIALANCEETECPALLAAFASALEEYVVTLDEAIRDLELAPAPPTPRIEPIWSTYTDYLRIRRSGAGHMIDGVRTADDELFAQGDLEWAEATAKSGELIEFLPDLKSR